MLSAETTLFLMICIMLYTIQKYPKFAPTMITAILLIPFYVVSNWADLRVNYALFMMIFALTINFGYLWSIYSNKKFQ
jgi:hypothetical protein